jgi:hypothetical protein
VLQLPRMEFIFHNSYMLHVYSVYSVCIQTFYNVVVFCVSYFTIRHNPWMFKESSHLIFQKVFFEDIHTLPEKYSVTCVQMTKDTLGHYLLVLSWLIFQYYVLQWSHVQYSNNDQGDQLVFLIELRRVWRYQIRISKKEAIPPVHIYLKLIYVRD